MAGPVDENPVQGSVKKDANGSCTNKGVGKVTQAAGRALTGVRPVTSSASGIGQTPCYKLDVFSCYCKQ